MPPDTALPDPEILARRVSALIAAGRTGAARPLLEAIRRMAPESAGLGLLAARLALREGGWQEAIAELDTAIAAAPADPAIRRLRAEARLQADDPAGAAADAAEAVIADPADPLAKALLAGALLDLGAFADAAACFAEAAREMPGDPAFRRGLAVALEASGRACEAAAVLAGAIADFPGAVGMRTSAILLAVRQRDFAAAVDLAEAARQAGVADACVFGLKGHALSSLGRHEEALEAYHAAFALAPHDPYVRHLVAAGGILPGADRAPEPYVRTVFDGYAPRFEAHLLGLGYRLPGLVRRELLSRRAAGPVLDLGCGTGLVAVACSDLGLGPWSGVDVSGGMLARAREKNLYADLHEADLESFLADAAAVWPVIVAADVLCYFGALDRPLTAIHARLAPGGCAIISLEARAEAPASSGPWALGRQGRYGHDPAYLAATAEAAGLAIASLRHETLRYEAGAPVQGLLVTLVRAGDV